MSAFAVAERDRARDRILELARADARVVAAAVVGSMADGPGDRWSDLDLTFGLAPGVQNADVLDDWTRELEREFQVVTLFDLPFQTSLYRVFLLPGNLQVDLSFTPASGFGALGPRFKLLFGEAVSRAAPPPPSSHHLFGLAVHHAVRARICIERGRLWQAEHWISGVREQALAIACLEQGFESAYARGADRLPVKTLARFAGALVRSIEREELLRALGCAVEVLLDHRRAAEAFGAGIDATLRDLVSAGWAGPPPASPPA
ncbi:MAG: hypothetical protein ACRENS_12075 [Candidatus Eiseniibacteriota bacterium]